MEFRANKGRQRIEMRRIQNDSKWQVTFSKRRYGLFKKANELSILSGAEIALLVESPGKKTFSFAHPSLLKVIDRYENVNRSLSNIGNAEQLMEVARRRRTEDLTTELASIDENLENEKVKSQWLRQHETVRQAQDWNERFVDEMEDKEKLNFVKNTLMKLGGKVSQQTEMLRQEQVEMMHQNATMTAIDPFGDFIEPNAATTRPLYKGESSSHNAMNLFDPLFPCPPPHPAGPWNETPPFF